MLNNLTKQQYSFTFVDFGKNHAIFKSIDK
ncbi:MAG: hypothetical protein H6Q16_2005 [Bacteroidetes bacterium]|nr:hypothetical protein [Bacteroidota bacterium]